MSLPLCQRTRKTRRRNKMTREQFDKLYNGKAVWCKTEALAKEFLALADSVGYPWPLHIPTFWGVYEEETVYVVEDTIGYCGKEWAKEWAKDKKGFAIVKFTGQTQVPQQSQVYDKEALAFELKLIDNHLSPLDNLIGGLIDLVKVEDLPKVKELREHYEKMSEIIESLKGE